MIHGEMTAKTTIIVMTASRSTGTVRWVHQSTNNKATSTAAIEKLIYKAAPQHRPIQTAVIGSRRRDSSRLSMRNKRKARAIADQVSSHPRKTSADLLTGTNADTKPASRPAWYGNPKAEAKVG